MTENNIFHVFDHNENESFEIVGIENLIDWLNENDDSFSFSFNPFTFEPREA